MGQICWACSKPNGLVARNVLCANGLDAWNWNALGTQRAELAKPDIFCYGTENWYTDTGHLSERIFILRFSLFIILKTHTTFGHIKHTKFALYMQKNQQLLIFCL